MEVTAENWDAALPVVLAAIADATFISIDTELSGLRPLEALRELPTDSWDARWAKVRFAASSMAMLQLGVCTFKQDATTAEWLVQPFSFFTVPSSSLSLLGHVDDETTFITQTSTMAFLGKHGFNFNTLATAPIPFMSVTAASKQEAAAAHHLETHFDKVRRSASGAIPSRTVVINGAAGSRDVLNVYQPADVAWYTSQCAAISAWCAGCSQVAAVTTTVDDTTSASVEGARGIATPAVSSNVSSSATSNSFPELACGACSPFQRALLHSFIGSRAKPGCVSDVLFVADDSVALISNSTDTYWKPMKCVWVGTGTLGYAVWEQLAIAAAVTATRAAHARARGLLAVLRAISATHVPLVGHNCLLDMAHIADKFIGEPALHLPTFATQWLRTHPYTYDTKHMAVTAVPELPGGQKLRQLTARSDLSGLYTALCNTSNVTNVLRQAGSGITTSTASPSVNPSASASDSVSATVAPTDTVTDVPEAPLCVCHLPPGFNSKFSIGSANAANSTTTQTDTRVASTTDVTSASVSVGPATMCHDAGADAYMTGVVFASLLALAHRLDGNTGSLPFVVPSATSASNGSETTPSAVAADTVIAGVPLAATSCTLTQLHAVSLNKLHLMRCTADTPWLKYLDLAHAAVAVAPKLPLSAQPTTAIASVSSDECDTTDTCPSAEAMPSSTHNNTYVSARAAVNNSKLLWIRSKHGSPLDVEHVRMLITNTLIMPLAAIDRRKHVFELDGSSLFVALPSTESVARIVALSTHMPGSMVTHAVDDTASSSHGVHATVAADCSSTASVQSTSASIHALPSLKHVIATAFGITSIATNTACEPCSSSEPAVSVDTLSWRDVICAPYLSYLRHFSEVFQHYCDFELPDSHIPTPTLTASQMASTLSGHKRSLSATVSNTATGAASTQLQVSDSAASPSSTGIPQPLSLVIEGPRPTTCVHTSDHVRSSITSVVASATGATIAMDATSSSTAPAAKRARVAEQVESSAPA